MVPGWWCGGGAGCMLPGDPLTAFTALSQSLVNSPVMYMAKLNGRLA